MSSQQAAATPTVVMIAPIQVNNEKENISLMSILQLITNIQSIAQQPIV